jgi:DNA repair protein RadA/Sms
MARKEEARYVCSACGHVALSLLGRCSRCGAWGSFERERIPGSGTSLRVPRREGSGILRKSQAGAVLLRDVSSGGRISSGLDEMDRVLGGGWMPGGVTLLAGEPGIGKSTLLLQICGAMAEAGKRVLYVSGEESLSQVAERARRLGAVSEEMELVASDDPSLFLDGVEQYALVVVDSVQSMRSAEVETWPGTPTQIRAVAQSCIDAAKGTNVPLVLVGHVTKDGQIAGPKLLEHMVDTVLSFSGEHASSHRLLRASKNRFGATDELGVFEMAQKGLLPVADPGRVFWSGLQDDVSGVARTVVLEGTRPFVAEVQALACQTPYPYPKRTTRGVELNRAQLLLAVLEKRCGLSSRNSDVFVNVAGGLQIRDPAADLALCAALASSMLDKALEGRCCFLGEVGLAGEVRPCGRVAGRLREAARLGFTRALVSRREAKDLECEMEVVRVGSLTETLRAVLP